MRDELDALFNATYSAKRPSSFKRAFRPSGFPYCGILDATKDEYSEYAKDFYLEIGTAVHAVVQEFISRSGLGRQVVYANWRCKDCKHLHEFSPLPIKCEACGADIERMAYEELEFEDIDGCTGHVDLFVLTSRGWIVADWKTSSTSGNNWRTEADPKHHHQLQPYCRSLEIVLKGKLKGKPIIGYSLMFVPRDKVSNRETVGLDVRHSHNWQFYVYRFDKAIGDATHKRLFLGKTNFNAVTHGFATGDWRAAALTRPCTSIGDFNANMGMRDGFYKGELCPNIDVCSASCKDVTRFLERNAIAARGATLRTKVDMASVRSKVRRAAARKPL